MTERFAIYYAPSATSNLWERAATWLGRDAADGDLFSGPVAGIDRDRLLNLTQSANRYGFHATLKAPMALAEGATEADLRAALTAFASQHQPIDLGKPRLASLSGFLALLVEPNEAPMALAEGATEADLRAALTAFASQHQPIDLGKPRLASLSGFLALLVEPNEALQDLAAHVVENFDEFRAPMSVKDRAARASKNLSERQIELLDAYGYPYVFEEFRFHMTLTDRLSAEDAADIAQAATTWFNPVLDEAILLDRLSLFHEPEAGKPFRRIADFKLGNPA